MRRLAFFRLALAISTLPAWSQAGPSGPFDLETHRTLTPSTTVPGLEQNPLKGLVPYAGTYRRFPYSMEWFYIPLKDVMTGPGTFRWDRLETKLEAIANRGHQAVFRFYLDHPGLPSGIPSYLVAAGLATRAYEGSGPSVSPDYSDPRLLEALTQFVAALGARYDGDPRIGFLTAGLYGFWGEWHTYPYPQGTPGEWTGWTFTQQSKDALLGAYQRAFHRTQVLVREPHTPDTDLASSFGYHDDSFAFSTIGDTSWHFWPKMVAAGLAQLWRTHTIGGEVRPEVQESLWKQWPNPPTAGAQDWETSVRTTHATWMLCQQVFQAASGGTLTAAQKENALRGAFLLGYELSFLSASAVPAAGGLDLRVEVSNGGVAPFPSDWEVQLQFADRTHRLVGEAVATSWRLTTVEPGEPAVWTMDGLPVPTGAAELLVRAVNPLSRLKAAALPLTFANREQGASVPGWLTLLSLQGDTP